SDMARLFAECGAVGGRSGPALRGGRSGGRGGGWRLHPQDRWFKTRGAPRGRLERNGSVTRQEDGRAALPGPADPPPRRSGRVENDSRQGLPVPPCALVSE